MIKTRNQSRLEAQTRIELAEKEKNKFKDYQYIVNKLAKISKKIIHAQKKGAQKIILTIQNYIGELGIKGTKLKNILFFKKLKAPELSIDFQYPVKKPMSDNEFLIYVETLRKQLFLGTFPYSIIEKEWEQLKNYHFYLSFLDYDPEEIKEMKKHMLLSILLKKDINNSFFMLKQFDYEEYTFEKIVFEGKYYILDKSAITSFFVSKTVTEALFQAFISYNCPVSKEKIRAFIVNEIHSINIYYVNTPKNVNGFLIYNGNIFLDMKLREQIKNLEIPPSIALSNILLTFFREIGTLLYLLLGEENNIFNNKLTKINNIYFENFGDYLLYLLFDSVDTIYNADSQFILNFSNYQIELSKFRENFILIHNQEKINKDKYLNYRVVVVPEVKVTSGCYMSATRNRFYHFPDIDSYKVNKLNEK